MMLRGVTQQTEPLNIKSGGSEAKQPAQDGAIRGEFVRSETAKIKYSLKRPEAANMA